MTQPVAPYLLYEDGEAAAEFLTRAFGFREVNRQVGAAGGMHLELATELGGRIYAGQAPQGYRNAEVIEELDTLPYGHRRYTARDAQGEEWSFAQVLEGA